ncbi:unnamed protein product, partial [Lepidochelys kempii]
KRRSAPFIWQLNGEAPACVCDADLRLPLRARGPGRAGPVVPQGTCSRPPARPCPPPPEERRPPTRLQERLLRKLGPNAHPFAFTIPQNLPCSVTLQPGPEDTGKACGSILRSELSVLTRYLRVTPG